LKIEEISYTALAAQTDQTVNFMSSNVAYRQTVYKTGKRKDRKKVRRQVAHFGFSEHAGSHNTIG
jgi:flagellar basal body rod protein FlgC